MIYMKNFLMIVASMVLISCSDNKKIPKEICLSKISYSSNSGYLMPPSLKVDFIDRNNTLSTDLRNDNLKNAFFYSVDSSDRRLFNLKYNHSERRRDTTSLLFSTNYFEFDKDKSWLASDIVNFLSKDGVGLVIGADTLEATKCK